MARCFTTAAGRSRAMQPGTGPAIAIAGGAAATLSGRPEHTKQKNELRAREGEIMAKNYSMEKVLDAVEISHGVTANVAAELGCTWETAVKYIGKWKATRELHEVQKCKLAEICISKYIEAIERGERWAIERALDTVGRRDGLSLVNRTEISGPDGGPLDRIEVEYIAPPPERLQIDADTWQELAGKIESMGLLPPPEPGDKDTTGQGD